MTTCLAILSHYTTPSSLQRQIMEEENGSNTYALEAHNRNIKRIDGFGQVSETCDAN